MKAYRPGMGCGQLAGGVVVRMGQTFNTDAWDTEAFLVELLETLAT